MSLTVYSYGEFELALTFFFGTKFASGKIIFVPLSKQSDFILCTHWLTTEKPLSKSR